MCGIVAMLGYDKKGISKWGYQIFINMLYADSLRGMHGTGMLAVGDEGEFAWAKVGGPPSQLFKTKEFSEVEKFFDRKSIFALLGHNRYATKGAKNTDNAHPFREQHIILVHNGTLSNYSHLPDAKKYEVDSELLAHSIAVDGIDKTITGLEGAWTIVYYDTKEKTFNVLRNHERPLYRTWHHTEGIWVFGSEEKLIEWCMNRNFYSEFTIEEVPPNILFTYSVNNEKPKERPLFGKPVVVGKTTYMEGYASGDTSGLCETDCGPVGDKEVKPPYKLTHKGGQASTKVTNGDWAFGKTGKLALPDPTKKKDGKPAKLWVPATSIHNIGVGDKITVQIVNYDLLDGSQDQYIFEGVHDDYPDMEFRAYVRGEAAAAHLLDNAAVGIQGTVFQIQKSTVPSAVNAHRIILHDPIPMFEAPILH